MRQLLYVSDSLIGDDVRALDAIMVRSRNNNAIDGLTGLLWTDGRRFAQVIEGDATAVADLLTRLRADPRHTRLEIVQDSPVAERQFGEWSMTRPATDSLAALYEQRMLRALADMTGAAGAAFERVIAGSRTNGIA